MKISTRRKGVRALDDSVSEDYISYCPRCLKNGFQEVLGNRIYKKGESYREGDEDNWRQCRMCGLLVPVYEIKREKKYKDVVDSSSDPLTPETI